ncbi:protocatechuate 3,4-dioxygenase [Nonomuraea sp. KC401]|uniref:Protocatechuate 3,4-dioxygenase n=1 Tax=Nonomuraea longispora TaxID=1848320 RepID=A0A4R4NS03_9ACTN|nr:MULTISPECIES: class III extradiol dioxygenase family protein [Nonomuraea]NBE95598.1 protocatechuate 3,4-dioxygenase [Nonomuraea sp. K271]TDC10657.1 protocatechuate 3,4-dioxygenase [Nonomuraea longispora]TLF71550.1 protocatechuate 3,4-dioxygenase [Nonomuraea sp. KC401]
MARIVGGLGTSHVPSIGAALDKGLRDTPEWKPFFDGYVPAQEWVREQRPDVAVVVFNDHFNALFLDRVPTFAVGCAAEYHPVDEGWGPRAIPPFEGAADFAWHLVDTLVDNHFDPEIIQEIKVDHGLQVPMELFWGRPPEAWPVKVVPIFVNVLQYPIPRPDRLYALGEVLGRAIADYDSDERFVVLGTGGLSHQLQGARAGFVNPDADRRFLQDIAHDPGKLAGWSREQYVETFGGEGAELIMWLVMRGALDPEVVVRHRHYFVPASMTGAGMIVLENA